MSYAAVARQAARYRESEVLSASPGQLVVIVYDHLIVNLKRARLLLAPADTSARSDALERARAAVTELLVTIDREKGGAIAAQLVSLYAFLLSELSVLGVKPEADRLDAIIGMVSELRDAFQGATTQIAPPTSAAAS